MIKLEVEIKDETFIYSYVVGDSRCTSESPLTPDQLSAFTDLLRHCSDLSRSKSRKFEKELTAKCWIKNNPEEAKKELESWKP